MLNVYSATNITVNQLKLSYGNGHMNKLVVELKDVYKVKISYRRRWFGMMHVYDLRFDILTYHDTLYTFYTDGIISKKGDYKRLVDFLESKNIIIYDPQNIRELLSLDFNDIQLVLRQRQWNGEKNEEY